MQATSDRPVPVTSFSYTSEAGHDLGKGAAEKFRDPAVPITVGGTAERVQMTVEVPDRRLADPASGADRGDAAAGGVPERRGDSTAGAGARA
ncbi:hypothetical protein [Streptomyces sp. NPDC126514]|uniref:hypothetical protein n=1 Tax=Streptomyces sp. NPDC126514 TaxID=3155210 RepID=UPI00331F4D9F